MFFIGSLGIIMARRSSQILFSANVIRFALFRSEIDSVNKEVLSRFAK